MFAWTGTLGRRVKSELERRDQGETGKGTGSEGGGRRGQIKGWGEWRSLPGRSSPLYVWSTVRSDGN